MEHTPQSHDALAEQIVQENITLYRQFAACYDQVQWYISNRYEQRSVQQEIDSMCRNLRRGFRVLDLACGTGNTTLKFLAYDCSIVAVDMSQEMLGELKKKINGYPDKKVSLQQSDAQDFVRNHQERYDVVCMGSFLHHILDYESFVVQAAQLVKQGGFLYINREPLHKRLLKRPGSLKNIHSKTLNGLSRLIDRFCKRRIVPEPDYTYAAYHYKTDGIDLKNILRLLTQRDFLKRKLRIYNIRKYSLFSYADNIVLAPLGLRQELFGQTFFSLITRKKMVPARNIGVSPKFIVKELSKDEGPLWDKYMAGSAQYNFFSSSFWLNKVSASTKMDYKIIVSYYDNEPVCGCAALVRKSLEGRLFTSAPLSPYSAIVFFPNNGLVPEETKQFPNRQQEALLMLSGYIKSRFDWTVLYLHPSFEKAGLLRENGWKIDQRYTYFLDLRDEEKLFQNFDSALKRKIKKGGKEEFCFKEGFDNLLSFYTLWRSTFTAQRIKPPLDWEGFSSIYNHLEEGKLCRSVSAYAKNAELAAGVIFLVDGRIAYYWASALNKKYAQSGVNQFLLWEGLRRLSGNGVETLDFVGADIPAIARYKKRFGGKLVLHSRAACVSSLQAKVVRHTKNIYKHLTRLLR